MMNRRLRYKGGDIRWDLSVSLKGKSKKLGELKRAQTKRYFDKDSKEWKLIERQEGKFDNGGYDSGIQWIK